MDPQQPDLATQPSTVTTKTIILEQSAHCDWDWLNTFLGYYNDGIGGQQPHEAVRTTLAAAISLMADYQSKTNQYFYSFCEMAYLQQYLEDNPSQIEVIKGLAQVLSLSSGGMTSADNLLSHGEAFIRNYLLGRQWAITTLGITPTLQMWVPDDFGHDAQLPIVLQAMGFMGVGFWRIGGNQIGNSSCQLPSSTAPSSILSQSVGLDFIWQANDESRVQAHWLINAYGEGNAILSSDGSGPDNSITWNLGAQDTINNFILQNLSDYTVNSEKPTPIPQHTPYLFVPVDGDFCTPYANLPDIINDWNLCNKNGGTDCFSAQPSATAGYIAEMGTFDQFMRLVQAYNDANAVLPVCYSTAVGEEIPFVPNPYFSGCYGSRPELKSLHYQTTRTLMQAEAMEIFLEYLAFTNSSQWNQIATEARASLAQGWLALLPSTHHDYITGTAPDNVYNGEQLSDLQQALAQANTIASGILQNVAGTIPQSTTPGGVTVAVFNSLGFGRSGLVEIPSPATGLVSAVTNGTDYFPVQYTTGSDGKPALLFMAGDPPSGTGVPSLGYSTIYLSDHASTITPKLKLKAAKEPGSYVLSNEFLRAVISPRGITKLYDLVNDPSHQHNLLGSGGSQIVFYNDNGNIYRFGNELPCSGGEFYLDTSITLEPQSLSITEKGPLRCTLTATATANQTLDFTTVYSLVAGEPFLRITTTGAAPSGYSVMVKIPFASSIETLTYGTAYHWDTRAPRNYIDWPPAGDTTVEGMTFEPTHEFVIPTAGDYLAAIYHASTPGWAIDSSGALLGCILRNTPGDQQAAWGTDSGAHTASYALRVAGKEGSATQLLSPSVGCNSGGPLGETLHFNNPLVGYIASGTSAAELPATMSIASTSDLRAVITALKAGTVTPDDLILRVYQPTNNTLGGVQVNLDSKIAPMFQSGNLNVVGQTALETALNSPESLSIVPAATSFTFAAPFSITTLALSRG
jgi:alpha-mannosidase